MCSTVIHVYTFRFASPGTGWGLSLRPSELLGALEEHVDLLTQQLGADVVTSDLHGMKEEDSVAVRVLSHCVDFAQTAARLAW